MPILSATPTRAAAARRACLALFSALAAFVVLQACVSAVVNIRFPEAMDATYGARLRRLRAAVASAPAPPRLVVMLGTSRTSLGLDAVGLSESLSQQLGRPVRAANFGVCGAGHVDELIAWRRLQRDGVRPDLVLVEVMPLYLGNDVAAYETYWMPAAGIDWLDIHLIQGYHGGTRPHIWRETALVEMNSLYSRRFALLHAVAPALLPRVGAEGRALVLEPALLVQDIPADERARAREAAWGNFGVRLSSLRLGGLGCDALRELLRSCREAGVPAAVVMMPEGPACRSWYAPEAWPTVRQWLEQECREDGAGFVNAREWFDEDAFCDSHHLLARGARAFTERLGREYVAPMLLQTSGQAPSLPPRNPD